MESKENPSPKDVPVIEEVEDVEKVLPLKDLCVPENRLPLHVFEKTVDTLVQEYKACEKYLPGIVKGKYVKLYRFDHMFESPLQLTEHNRLSDNRHNIYSISSENAWNLVTAAHTLLKRFGYRVPKSLDREDKKQTAVEYHEYRSDSEDVTIASVFGCHQDNDGPLYGQCCSVLFYLENSFSRGGELHIQYSDEWTILDTIDTRYYTCVLLDGHTHHSITPVSGVGVRRLYSVFIQSPDEYDDEDDDENKEETV